MICFDDAEYRNARPKHGRKIAATMRELNWCANHKQGADLLLGRHMDKSAAEIADVISARAREKGLSCVVM